MARGDVFIEKLAAAGSFQPAAGVEVCITSLTNTPVNGVCTWEYWNGASCGKLMIVPVGGFTVQGSVKYFITNTIYMHTTDAGGTGSGVQVK